MKNNEERLAELLEGLKKKNPYKLPCRIFAKTKDMSQEEWLQLRKQGITGTDLGGLTGVSKYTTPIRIYLDKTGAIPPTEDNEKMYWGRVMEDVIKKEFALRHKEFKVLKPNAILQHYETDWALANVDGIINRDGEKGILEIKTVSEYLKYLWGSEEVPPQYMVQIQWYMYVTGATFGYFAAVLGGNEYIEKYVERDQELIDMLVSIAKDFWENNYLKKNPPAVDGSEASTNLLSSLYPVAVEKTEIDLTDEALTFIEKREELKAQEKVLKEEISECENQLKSLLQDNEIGMVQGRKVIWKNQSRTSIDSKKLKLEKPDIFEAYCKTSSFRKFDIK